MTWIESLILTFIHPSLYINTHTSISISYCYSISIYNISICLLVVAAYPCNPSHPGALTRCKPNCRDQQCGPAKHSSTITNDCDRSHLLMFRHNYMRKRNWQLDWFSIECQTDLLDSRRCTMVRQDALRWNWMSSKDARINKSQTVLVDSCWCTSFSNLIVLRGYRGRSLSGHLHGADLICSICVNAARSASQSAGSSETSTMQSLQCPQM